MQYALLIHGMQVGTGILSLPRQLAEVAGTDGWISIILAWLLNLVFGIIIVVVMKQYPNDTLPDLLKRLFGRIIGKAILFLFFVHFAFFSWSILVNTTLYIKAWFLPRTWTAWVMLLFVVPAYVMARNQLHVIARYCEAMFYITLWMLPILLIPLKSGYFIYLLPIVKEGWEPIFQAIQTTTFSFLGFEIVFIVYPLLKRKDLAIHGVILGNTLTMLLYVFSTIICFVFFSPDEITEYNQPILNLLKIIEFRFLERFDIIFLALYLFIISTAWVPYIYGTAFIASSLVGTQKKHATFVILFCIAVTVLAAFLEPSWLDSEKWKVWAGDSGIVIAYILPVLLLLYIKIVQIFTPRGALS